MGTTTRICFGACAVGFSPPSDLKPHVCHPKPRHSPHSCSKLTPLIVSFWIPLFMCYVEWNMTAKSLLPLIHVNLKRRLHNVPFLSLHEPGHASTPLLSRHHVCLEDVVSSHFQLRPTWRTASTESNAWTYAYPMYAAQDWWFLWATAQSPGNHVPSWAPQPTTALPPGLTTFHNRTTFQNCWLGSVSTHCRKTAPTPWNVIADSAIWTAMLLPPPLQASPVCEAL